MKRKRCRGLVLTMAMSLIFSVTQAQDKCSEILLRASTAFNEGKYEQVVSLLETKIADCDFGKVEQEQAIKLISSALAELDEIEKAEDHVYELLDKNPNYEIQSTVDPIPFVSLLDKFTRSPRSIIGITMGQTLPLIRSQKSYRVWSESATSDYSSELGFTFSLYYQYYMYKNWSVIAAPEVSSIKFGTDVSTYEDVHLKYNEKASLLTFPLNIRYDFYKGKKMSVGLSAGLNTSFLFSTQSELNYQLPDDGVMNTGDDLLLQRKSQNYGYQTGLNLSYTKNKLRLTADLGYSQDLMNFNNSVNRYNSSSFLYDYNYVDNDFKLSQLKFKLGIAYTISYKIKHKYRTR